MLKTERLQLALSTKERERLEQLAWANSGGNNSLMIRTLINLAYVMPSALNLHEPAPVEKESAWIPALAATTTRRYAAGRTGANDKATLAFIGAAIKR